MFEKYVSHRIWSAFQVFNPHIAKRNCKFGFWNNHELETKDEFTQKDFKMNSKQSLWFQFLRYLLSSRRVCDFNVVKTAEIQKYIFRNF